MTLLNFFKRHLTLARLVAKLQKEAKTYRKQIGGHKASFTEIKNAWNRCKAENGCIEPKISHEYKEAV